MEWSTLGWHFLWIMNYSGRDFCFWKCQVHCQDRQEGITLGVGFLIFEGGVNQSEWSKKLILPCSCIFLAQTQCKPLLWFKVPGGETGHYCCWKSQGESEHRPAAPSLEGDEWSLTILCSLLSLLRVSDFLCSSQCQFGMVEVLFFSTSNYLKY